MKRQRDKAHNLQKKQRQPKQKMMAWSSSIGSKVRIEAGGDCAGIIKGAEFRTEQGTDGPSSTILECLVLGPDVLFVVGTIFLVRYRPTSGALSDRVGANIGTD
jgi:hypothetical protein